MPERQKGQSLSDYVSICIASRRKEHPDEPQDKSIAACYSMGRSWWKQGGKSESRSTKEGVKKR